MVIRLLTVAVTSALLAGCVSVGPTTRRHRLRR